MGVVLAALLASVVVPPAGAQGVCPAGTRLVGGQCVKDQAAAWQAPSAPEPVPTAAAPAAPESCGAFNARVAAFLKEKTGSYARMGANHADLEASIDREAQRDRRLEATLRWQAARSRDLGLRATLLAQSRNAGEAAAGAEARLRAAVRADRALEERFKDVYKIEARALVAQRPAGCAVKE
ncbi:MAG: hypothetical protein KGL53_12830 [Elusimicrobia bacterium]|nr:hypothetical protein [Elusimicrobiota bacterium]